MAKPDIPTSSAPAETRVKLLKPHEHAGRDYPSGAVLTLPADSAAWLIAIGVAQPQ